MLSMECNSENYTKLTQDILNFRIGLAYSGTKVVALWGESGFIVLSSVLCFVMAIAILLLNGIVLRHYVRKYREIIPLLYTSLSICDIGNALSALLIGSLLLIVLTNYESPEAAFPGMAHVINITYILFSHSSRVSVLYNTVLAIIRTINVVFPTHVIQRSKIVAVLIVGHVLWFTLAGLDIVGLEQVLGYFENSVDGENMAATTRYHVLLDALVVNPLTGFLMFYHLLEKTCMIRYMNINWLFILFKGVPFVLPSILSMACMIIQTYFLVFRSRVGRRSAVSRRITITVMYLTAVFVTCNIPDFVLNLVLLTHIAVKAEHLPMYMCGAFSASVLLPFVNSLLNPLILIKRGTTLRASVIDCIQCRDGATKRRKGSALETMSREQAELMRYQSRYRY